MCVDKHIYLDYIFFLIVGEHLLSPSKREQDSTGTFLLCTCSPSKSVGNCLGNILSEHILDAHRIYWKQDLLHDGKASQTIPRGRVRQGDTFFGLSKPDIPGDKLGFRPPSVRPVHTEQSLSTTSRYTRGTNG